MKRALILSLALAAVHAPAAAQEPCNLEVDPPSLALEVGQTAQLKATATLPKPGTTVCSGETRDVTREAKYQSSAPAAKVQAGLVTAAQEGVATITVRLPSQTFVVGVKVTPNAAPGPAPTPGPTPAPAPAAASPGIERPAASVERSRECEELYKLKYAASAKAQGWGQDIIDAELGQSRPLPCGRLAAQLDSDLGEQKVADLQATTVRPTPAEVKPPMPDAVGAQGSAGEVTAVPSVAPNPLIGATVALAGTEGGPRLITAVGLNPGSLAAEEGKTYAVQSRLADIAVVLPTRLDNDDGSAFEYVGVRVRLNFLASLSGEEAYDAARAQARAAYRSLGAAQVEPLLGLERMLVGASDVAACYEAVLAHDSDAIGDKCGVAAPDTTALERSEAEARAALEHVRTVADGTTFGLDLRANFGDFTLSGAEEAEHAFGMVASVAVSHRVVGSQRLGLGLRARVGGAYAHMDESDEGGFDWGAAAELAAGIGDGGQIRVSAGLEGRVGSDDAPDLTDTNFTDLKLGFSVPASEGTSIGLGVSVPVSGEHSFVLTTAGDLAAFLP